MKKLTIPGFRPISGGNSEKDNNMYYDLVRGIGGKYVGVDVGKRRRCQTWLIGGCMMARR